MSKFAEDSLSDESLQRELQHKDDIILALTEQLEGTVDQLDRLKRSGVKESTGELRTQSPFGIASQVSQALEAYEELDPAEHFDRIENGISQILELLTNGSINVSDSTGNDDVSDGNAYWEETKAKLLGERVTKSSTVTNQASSQSGEDELDSEIEIQEQADSSGEGQPVVIPSMPGAPKPIVDLKDSVALEEGLGERDQYIAYLIARLRYAEQAKFPVFDWEDLSAAPEKLVNELLDIKKKLEDQLRQSEIAVSLERASLTRERSKLFQVKQYLAQEVKRLGSVVQETNDENSKPTNAESRWGKFFDTKK